jgi:hypothetical protein
VLCGAVRGREECTGVVVGVGFLHNILDGVLHLILYITLVVNGVMMVL